MIDPVSAEARHDSRQNLLDCREAVAATDPRAVSGRLTRVTGLVMEASGLQLAVGSCVPGAAAERRQRRGRSRRLLRRPALPDADRRRLRPHAGRAGDAARAAPWARRRSAQPPRPRRRAADHAKHLPVGDGAARPRASTAPAGRSTGWAPLACEQRASRCTAGRSIRSTARRSASRSTSACAPSTRCSPSGAASAWACSPAPASARACCSA